MIIWRLPANYRHTQDRCGVKWGSDVKRLSSKVIGNAVSKCAFYCSPNCVSASVRKRYTIHIITANYWHHTSGTLVNQNAHLLTLPTIKYGSEIKIPGKCFFVVQVLLFLLRPEILRVCSGQLEQFRLERAIMGSDFVKNFMTYITVIISELQRNCEKKWKKFAEKFAQFKKRQ